MLCLRHLNECSSREGNNWDCGHMTGCLSPFLSGTTVAPTFVTSTTFCYSSPVFSIHINRFCQPQPFCQLLSPQSSPVLSTISTTYVATNEVTTFVTPQLLLDRLGRSLKPFVSTVIPFCHAFVSQFGIPIFIGENPQKRTRIPSV